MDHHPVMLPIAIDLGKFYNNSLTWNKATLGMFPRILTMMIVRENSEVVLGRYNLSRYVCIYIYILSG